MKSNYVKLVRNTWNFEKECRHCSLFDCFKRKKKVCRLSSAKLVVAGQIMCALCRAREPDKLLYAMYSIVCTKNDAMLVASLFLRQDRKHVYVYLNLWQWLAACSVLSLY